MIGTNDNAKGIKTVLVVDDDEDVRKVAICMLNQQGYDLLEATDSSAALKVLNQNGPLCNPGFR